jgi:hypothetical protein
VISCGGTGVSSRRKIQPIGKYEYMPDNSWKATGTCTDTYKGGDTKFEAWEEGSHLKDYTYKITGGTGKYQGASGGGTYIYENLTDTLAGGTYRHDTAALVGKG